MWMSKDEVGAWRRAEQAQLRIEQCVDKLTSVVYPSLARFHTAPSPIQQCESISTLSYSSTQEYRVYMSE